MGSNTLSPEVLFVDDDRLVLSSSAQALTAHGYNVTTAASGEEALQQLQKHHFAAAVVDLVLPDIGGIEVIAAVREADPTTVVIIITGYASLDSAIEAVRYGTFDYLRKPVPTLQLTDTLARGLEGRELLHRNQRLLAELDRTNRDMRLAQSTLKERVHELHHHLNALVELGQHLSDVHDPHAIMHHLLDTAINLTGAQAGAIFQKDVSLNELHMIVSRGLEPGELWRQGLQLGSGVLGQVGESGQRQVINNLLGDPQLAKDDLVYIGMRRVLAQPLTAAGELLGILTLFDDLNQPFSTDEQDLVAMLAVQAATILQAPNVIRLRPRPAAAGEAEPEELIDLG